MDDVIIDNSKPVEVVVDGKTISLRAKSFGAYCLDLVIKAPHIKNIINTQKNSTNDNISMTDICNFLVPVPPLQEQSRIVRKLNCLASIMSR